MKDWQSVNFSNNVHFKVLGSDLMIRMKSPCGKDLRARAEASYIDQLTGVDPATAPADVLEMVVDSVISDGELTFVEPGVVK